MSENNNTIPILPENNRMIQTNLNYLRTNNNLQIMHKGYIDISKLAENMRILVLNPKGLNLWNDYKMDLFINSCKKKQIDVILLSETQIKWTPRNIDRMKQRIHSISRNAVVSGADSKQWDVTP